MRKKASILILISFGICFSLFFPVDVQCNVDNKTLLVDSTCNPVFTTNLDGCHECFFLENISDGIFDSVYWDFDDGITSVEYSPSHEFTDTGSYIVCLSVFADTSCSATFCDTIQILPCNIIVSDSITPVSCKGSCNGIVDLTIENVTGQVSIFWNGAGIGTSQTTYPSLCAGTYSLTLTDSVFCQYSSSFVISEPDSLLTNITKYDVKCKNACDGKLVTTTTGGTWPYFYSWSDNAFTAIDSNLCPGMYSVTIVDNNNCLVTASGSITEPTKLIFQSITYQDVECYSVCEAAIQISVEGGTPQYSYYWDNGKTTQNLDSLCQAVYRVTVTDANNCKVSNLVIISQPPPLLGTTSVNAATCHEKCNGSITSSISGGTYPYTVKWSDSSSVLNNYNLCAGFYTATITDGNQCTSLMSGTVSEPDTLILTITDSIHLNCFIECLGVISVSVSGGTPGYSYLWNNNATETSLDSLCVGTYYLTVTDSHSCPVSTSVALAQPPEGSIILYPTNVTGYGLCNGKISALVQGGTPFIPGLPYEYTWSTGSTDSMITSLCDGMYYLTISDKNGCEHYDSVRIRTPENHSLSGFVYAGTSLLPQGIVVLFKLEENQSYSSMRISTVENGAYHFDHLNVASYTTYAVPYFNLDSLFYPVYMPTYYGDKLFWENAGELSLTDEVANADIHLGFYPGIIYGKGVVSGNIQYTDNVDADSLFQMNWFDAFSKKLTTTHGANNVTLFLLDATETPVKFCLSDSLGNFSMKQVPPGSYYLHAEKAGYVSEKAQFLITDSMLTVSSRDFYIHPGQILLGMKEFQLQENNFSVTLFPNPANDHITLQVVSKKPETLHIEIFSVQGVLLLTKEIQNQFGEQLIELDVSGIGQGYFIMRMYGTDGNGVRVPFIRD